MLTPAKTAKEKPSIVSKKVLKTHLKNGTESYLLTEKIKALEHKHFQKNLDIDIEVNSLKKKMETVQRVKEKISLSKERRMLLKSQGFTIRVCKSGVEDEIILRRDSDSLQVHAGKWANLLANPPDLTPQDESLTLSQDAVESNEDTLESKTSDRIRSVSLSSVADSIPTQVSRYRVIEPPLRPGSRRGFTTLGTKSTLKKDQEVCEEFNDNVLSMLSSERAPTGSDVVKNRPWSGKSLFFETVIAARNNHYFAHNRDAAKARMENYRERKSLAGRRTMSAPVKVTSTTTILTNERKLENQPGEKKRLESCSEVKSSDYHDQKDLVQTTEKDEIFGSMENKLKTSVKDKTSSERDRSELSALPVSSDSKVTFTSSKPQENTPVQDNTGNFVAKEKTKIYRDERNTENDCETNLLLIDSDQTECNERSKCVKKFNEVRAIQTSKLSTGEVDEADVLNPVLLNGEEALASEDTDGDESCLKNKRQDYVVDSDTATQTSSGKNHLSLSDRVSHMSIRRHSADGEINNNRRLHGNKARNECANNDAEVKRHVALQLPKRGMLSRRMSHPPRIVNIHEKHKLRKRKPLKNEDEIVYAYDARPDKSLAKGYRAMQMTVGGRQVKISMAAFPKESGKVQVDRAKLNAKLSSLQGKIQEPKLL